jgi:branched-subunit amino acid ABC-type transport system permease component
MGFNIIYNTTGIINFAQGEFVMLGGMSAVTLHRVLPLPAAIAAAVLVTMVAGALIEMVFMRWLEKPSVLRMIIITIGISILVREAALLLWGNDVRMLPYFTGTEVTAIPLGGARVSPQVLWTVGACAAMVALITLFFRQTMVEAGLSVGESRPCFRQPTFSSQLLGGTQGDGRSGSGGGSIHPSNQAAELQGSKPAGALLCLRKFWKS